MAASFQQRGLRFTFKMRTGSFSGEGEPDTVVYEAFRSSVQIKAPGGWQYATAQVSIKGLSQDVMSRLTIINYTNMELQRNEITIEATDNDGAYSILFVGTIANAYVDYMGAPEVALNIEAYQSIFSGTEASPPTSWPGPNKVGEIASSLAAKFGYKLDNNGVDTTITDQVLTGSSLNQLRDLCKYARCQLWLDERSMTATIAPLGSPTKAEEVEISPESGLVGWPTPTHQGVEIICLYNPEIRHGGAIHLKTSVSVSSSQVTPSGQQPPGQVVSLSGKWYVAGMSLVLDCETPGGAWFMYLTCYPISSNIKTR